MFRKDRLSDGNRGLHVPPDTANIQGTGIDCLRRQHCQYQPAASGSKISWRKLLIQPFTNPVIIASGLGAAVALTGWTVPGLLLKPIGMLAGGAVPMVLLAFGLSLAGKAPLQKGDGRTESLAATCLEIIGMPLIVWALGRFVFGLEGQHLLASVIMGALPTAQNVFLFAAPYGRGVIVARDVILCTTLLCAGSLLVIAWLLG
jgi:malonate transporter